VTDPPPIEGLKRLLAETRPEAPAHPVELWTLGEFAALLVRAGEAAAAAAFPEVAAHLATDCAACADHLAELRTAVAHEAEVSRALTQMARARRYLEEIGADDSLVTAREPYYQRRWDPGLLADANALLDELDRRLNDLQSGE
jgi:hypothetical protein